MKGDNAAAIRQATERVTQAGTRLLQAAQQTAGGSGAAGGGATSGESERPDVVDAEFEEVDKRNRKAS
jgi:molecular chaperone DnaK